MKKLIFIRIMLVGYLTTAQNIKSPSNNISLDFLLFSNGKPTYSVNYKNKPVISRSNLGLLLKDGTDFTSGFIVEDTSIITFDEAWQPVLGEQTNIRNNYNQLTVHLIQKATLKKLNIIFKVYNEGVAFRYEFPKQANLNYFIISDEKSEFRLTDDHKAFWIPGDFDSNEYAYNETLLSAIDTEKIDLNNGIGVKSISGKYTVQSPLMMKSTNGIYLNIFEAAVVNYPVMHLELNKENYSFTSKLVPNAIGDKAYLQTPAVSPWRTIMISDDARDIVSSKMILNLNEPSKIDDTSWIKPMKYVGIWWEMHVGKATWDYAGSQNAQNTLDQLKPSGKHGATTENTKRYIDFAAQHG
ncbi:glycoside hydrolase family 97 N-terminal domain-containing protein, partial [Flavobacterium sp.]|uniref:glycoside hydrolase family 97 N-terminal domain-containing protein n=1 Tax=Flavobacterium sp. TaxID=239 RepID=UPI002BF79C44